ncbi:MULTISPECIES: hypothetical protein [unclassified Microcoleus]|uniref:hypothetical protein n=1 Tax=unclassified Microcoleus TaxID=2642155 RepID=UPI002FD11DCB
MRNEFIALLMRLYPQRLGDILQQHLAFSTLMSISEKLQKVDQLKAWLDSFRQLSPTLVAELKKLYSNPCRSRKFLTPPHPSPYQGEGVRNSPMI